MLAQMESPQTCALHKDKGTCNTCGLCKRCPPINIPAIGSLPLEFSSVLDHNFVLLQALKDCEEGTGGTSTKTQTQGATTLQLDAAAAEQLMPPRSCWPNHTVSHAIEPVELRKWFKVKQKTSNTEKRKSGRERMELNSRESKDVEDDELLLEDVE